MFCNTRMAVCSSTSNQQVLLGSVFIVLNDFCTEANITPLGRLTVGKISSIVDISYSKKHCWQSPNVMFNVFSINNFYLDGVPDLLHVSLVTFMPPCHNLKCCVVDRNSPHTGGKHGCIEWSWPVQVALRKKYSNQFENVQSAFLQRSAAFLQLADK